MNDTQLAEYEARKYWATPKGKERLAALGLDKPFEQFTEVDRALLEWHTNEVRREKASTQKVMDYWHDKTERQQARLKEMGSGFEP